MTSSGEVADRKHVYTMAFRCQSITSVIGLETILNYYVNTSLDLYGLALIYALLSAFLP